MSQTLVASQNALSTTAEIVLAENPGRDVAEIKNIDTAIAVYFGFTAAVTASTGHKLAPGEAFVFERYQGPVYAIAASGTPTITVAEW